MTLVQGFWKTGQVWVNGESLTRDADRCKDCVRDSRFTWGTHGEGSMRLAMVLLERFVRTDQATRLCESFSKEILSNLGQIDFKVTINIQGWIATHSRKQNGRRK